LEPQRRQQLVVGEREVEDVVERLHAARALHARMERRIDGEPLGETVDEGRPPAALVKGMEVDERGALPAREHAEAHGTVADVDYALGGGGHAPFTAPDGHHRSLWPGHTSRTYGRTSLANSSVFWSVSSFGMLPI